MDYSYAVYRHYHDHEAYQREDQQFFHRSTSKCLRLVEVKLIARLAARPRRQESLTFLRTVDEETPGDLAINIPGLIRDLNA